MRWKITDQGREEGNAKEEGKSTHQHDTPGPERANPERARKEKTKADGNRRPAEGGEDGSAWNNLSRRNLSLPTSARARPNLPAERKTHEKGIS